MMREILFRGKALVNHGILKQQNGWVYGVPVPIKWDAYMTKRIEIVECHGYDELDGYDLLSEDDEIDPKTIGQYTGLRDKNGVKIFEGDIVNIDEHEVMVNGCYQVIYSEENHCYALQRSIEHHYNYFSFSELNGFTETSEVIGNIYDNPELLEVK